MIGDQLTISFIQNTYVKIAIQSIFQHRYIDRSYYLSIDSIFFGSVNILLKPET
jgi:hypothetical protein